MRARPDVRAPTVLMHCSYEPTFPWDELHRLHLDPDVTNPQLEDGYPPLEEIGHMNRPDPLAVIWLVQAGEVFVGFGMVRQLGVRWAEVHISFRRGVPGALKKRAALWMMAKTFTTKIDKLSAFIPEFNRPACMLAYACGLRREGFISHCFYRNEQWVGRVVFGVTGDEFRERIG